MKTRAAILVEPGRSLEIVDLELPALRPGQLLVEIAFSGVCHTQLLEARGHRGPDKFLPHCLGHEGSGVVREVGSRVSKLRPDDDVVLSWMKGSGANEPGTVYRWGDRDVNAGAVTTFQQFAIVSENRCTTIPSALPKREAALVGCALATGAGAVLNSAGAVAGDSIAVFGVGGVGLCAVAAAVAAGCAPIIAVDIVAGRLERALELGATHVVNSAERDVVASVFAVCSAGVDHAIEASGRPEVMEQALRSVRSQGGRAVAVGNARFGERLSLDPQQLNQGKSLLGTWGGDCQPDRDFPRFSRLVQAGHVPAGRLLGGTYRLDQVNTALGDLEAGQVGRPLIGF
jgi:S-(hydroxymethyl)glutathione dehydrogenase/alcohol dehydrogenase